MLFVSLHCKSVPAPAGPQRTDSLIALKAFRRCHHIGRRHQSSQFGDGKCRPNAPVPREVHVNSLNLLTRKLFLNVQIQPHECKRQRDRLSCHLRMLSCERIHNMLMNEQRIAVSDLTSPRSADCLLAKQALPLITNAAQPSRPPLSRRERERPRNRRYRSSSQSNDQANRARPLPLFGNSALTSRRPNSKCTGHPPAPNGRDHEIVCGAEPRL